MASVSVEGSGSFVNVEGFSDLSPEPLSLPHLDLGVIQCVTMTSGRGVLQVGRVEVFSICVFSEPGTQHRGCLINVFLVTSTTLNTVYHSIVFFILGVVLGVYQPGP